MDWEEEEECPRISNNDRHDHEAAAAAAAVASAASEGAEDADAAQQNQQVVHAIADQPPPEPREHEGSFAAYMSNKINKLQQQNAEDSTMYHTSNIFQGLSIMVNGWTSPPSTDIRRIVLEHGGDFLNYNTTSSRVTHVVATNLPDAKLRLLSKGNPPAYVTPGWIVDSANAKTLLPISRYLLMETRRTGALVGNQQEITRMFAVSDAQSNAAAFANAAAALARQVTTSAGAAARSRRVTLCVGVSQAEAETPTAIAHVPVASSIIGNQAELARVLVCTLTRLCVLEGSENVQMRAWLRVVVPSTSTSSAPTAAAAAPPLHHHHQQHHHQHAAASTANDSSNINNIVALPPMSELDPSVLDALPLTMRREIQQAYESSRRGAQRVLGASGGGLLAMTRAISAAPSRKRQRTTPPRPAAPFPWRQLESPPDKQQQQQQQQQSPPPPQPQPPGPIHNEDFLLEQDLESLVACTVNGESPSQDLCKRIASRATKRSACWDGIDTCYRVLCALARAHAALSARGASPECVGYVVAAEREVNLAASEALGGRRLKLPSLEPMCAAESGDFV